MTEHIIPNSGCVSYSHPYSHHLRQGLFVDVSQIGNVMGFEYKVAISMAVWRLCVHWTSIDSAFVGIYQSEERRLSHLLETLKSAINQYNRQQVTTVAFPFAFIRKSIEQPLTDTQAVSLCFRLATYGEEGEAVLEVVLSSEASY